MEEINKAYYTIGEVAEILELNSSLIRFWEKEFDSLNPKKNKKGNRLFRPEDIELLKKIKYLVKEKKYTLQGAKEALTSKETPETIPSNNRISKQEFKSLLIGVKKKLLDIRENL